MTTLLYDLPQPRFSHGFVHDRERDVFVVFGGALGPSLPFTYLNDTWEYDGLNWRLILTHVAPTPRANPVMVYDTARKATILFGGTDDTTIYTDTWRYTSSTGWTQLFPATTPTSLNSPSFAYDEVRERLVMFGGGLSGFMESDETWEWDGSDWTLMSPATKPPVRVAANMGYDPGKQRIVIHSGFTNGLSGPSLQTYTDTWAWDGVDWATISATPPPSTGGVFNAQMEYSTQDGKMTIMGGLDSSFFVLDSTFVLAETGSVTAWRDASTTRRPTSTVVNSMIRDDLREDLRSWGGGDFLNYSAELWAYRPDVQWNEVGFIYDETEIEVGVRAGTVARGAVLADASSVADSAVTTRSFTVVGQVRSFSADVIEPGDDEVRISVLLNNDPRWWDGSKWARSDGTFANSNRPEIIDANIKLLPMAANDLISWRGHLHSDSGATTPELLSLSWIDEAVVVPFVPPQAPTPPLANPIIVSSTVVETKDREATKIEAVLEADAPLQPTAKQFVLDNNLLPEILVRAGLAEGAPLDQITDTGQTVVGSRTQHTLEIAKSDE